MIPDTRTNREKEVEQRFALLLSQKDAEIECLKNALRWLRDGCGVNLGSSIEKMLAGAGEINK